MKTYSNIRYLGGIPGLVNPHGGTLTIQPDAIVWNTWGSEKARIPIGAVDEVAVFSGGSKQVQGLGMIEKDKSVIGRAAVGGLLLGPIGAVIGGISGVGKKQKIGFGKKTVERWQLAVAYVNEGQRCTALFESEAPWRQENTIRRIANEITTQRHETRMHDG